MNIHFTRRQKTILHELYHTNDYLTSMQLAQTTQVSDRTIKTEMRIIMDIAKEYGGFHIESKRNHGYLLVIDDPQQFESFKSAIEMVHTYSLDLEDESIIRFMTIARALIVASEPIKVEHFAQSLYISFSQVHKTLDNVRDFYTLHHLQLVTKGNKGLIVEGDEYNRRMVIMELYGVHFHRFEIQAEPDFLDCIGPDETRRQAIRHVFLKVLRGSTIRLLDNETQRLSIYLSIVDRRYPLHSLTIPDHWKKILQHSPELDVSNQIFTALHQEIIGFDYDDAEVIAFAVELLTREDIDALAYTPFFHPYIHVQVSKLCTEIRNALYQQMQLNLFAQDWSMREFEAITTPIVARKVFGELCHAPLPFSNSNAEICNSPLSLTVALSIERQVELNLQMKLERSEIIRYAYFAYKVCAYTKFQINPVNLILTSGNGMNTARILEKRIRERFGTLIGHTRCMELYEGRGINLNDYDAVLMDMDSFVYNYDLPCRVVHLVKRSHQLDDLYNDLLMKAHQYQWYVPTDDQFTYIDDYPSENAEAFIKNLAYRYSSEQSVVERMTSGWKKYLDICNLTKTTKGIILFVDGSLFDHEWFELLTLENDLTIGKAKIQHVFVVCIHWNYDEIKLKFWENILKQATLRDDFFDQMHHGASAIEGLIKEALKIN